MNENFIGQEERELTNYHEGTDAARREEREAQMRAQCKRITLLKKERVVNGTFLK